MLRMSGMSHYARYGEGLTVTLASNLVGSESNSGSTIMQNELKGKRIAILVADGFAQVEMTEPRKALDQAGAKTELISPATGKVQAWKHQDKGDKFPVDVAL